MRTCSIELTAQKARKTSIRKYYIKVRTYKRKNVLKDTSNTL
jgi:hypothetical protein